jgi:hypothetical protein
MTTMTRMVNTVHMMMACTHAQYHLMRPLRCNNSLLTFISVLNRTRSSTDDEEEERKVHGNRNEEDAVDETLIAVSTV